MAAHLRLIAALLLVGACSTTPPTTQSPSSTTDQSSSTTAQATTSSSASLSTTTVATSLDTQAPFSELPPFVLSEEGSIARSKAQEATSATIAREGFAAYLLNRLPMGADVMGFDATHRQVLQTEFELSLPSAEMTPDELVEAWTGFSDAFFEDWPPRATASVSPQEWIDTFGWSELDAEIVVSVHGTNLPVEPALVLLVDSP